MAQAGLGVHLDLFSHSFGLIQAFVVAAVPLVSLGGGGGGDL